jgi:hypothetical protein
MLAHMDEPPPIVSEHAPDAPPALDDVVRTAMAKHPDERYPTAGALGSALLAAGVAQPAPTPTPERRPAPRFQSGLVVAALTEPFNVIVLGALLVMGELVGNLQLMIPLALLVYAAGVVRSYRDPDTARRVRGAP